MRLLAHKREAALDAFRSAQKLDPNDPQVIYDVCRGLSATGKDKEAIDLATGFLKQQPDNEPFNQLLGTLLTQAGREEEECDRMNRPSLP